MGSRGISARYVKLAGNELQEFLWSNLCGVSDQDFRTPQHILLRNFDGQEFVIFGVPTRSIPRGGFYLNEKQRQWARVGKNDAVSLEPYDPSWEGDSFYLGAVEVAACYASVNPGASEVYPEAELKKALMEVCNNQCLQPNQKILVDFRGAKLLFTVRGICRAQLGVTLTDPQMSSDPYSRGVLYNGSKVKVIADNGDPRFALRVASQETGSTAQPIFAGRFKFSDLGIGGLDHASDHIYRMVFLSRMTPPAVIKSLGLKHTRGMLLHGPPGTGKTLIARKIGQLLNAHPPKIINGPEVLNKFVGQSEENVRKVFEPAEAEQKERGDDSQLHVIIIDELDAICKSRGKGGDGGTGVGDNIVNTLLTKLDGIDQLNNILLIGMTNRKDLVDDALLRPGRMEVHVEIGLPDEAGRYQVLRIHAEPLIASDSLGPDVDFHQIAKITRNYSGAELESVIRKATLFAIDRANNSNSRSPNNAPPSVTMADLEAAVVQVPAAFGNHEDEMRNLFSRGIIKFNPDAYEHAHTEIMNLASLVKASKDDNQKMVVIDGPVGSGKTALAAHLAMCADFSHTKVISPSTLNKYASELDKKRAILEAFEETERSPETVILLDDVENIIEWESDGPRYSRVLFWGLRALFGGRLSHEKHRLIMITTSQFEGLSSLGLFPRGSTQVSVLPVQNLDELCLVFREMGGFAAGRERDVCGMIHRKTNTSKVGLGIKMVMERYHYISMFVEDREDQLEVLASELASAIMEGR